MNRFKAFALSGAFALSCVIGGIEMDHTIRHGGFITGTPCFSGLNEIIHSWTGGACPVPALILGPGYRS